MSSPMLDPYTHCGLTFFLLRHMKKSDKMAIHSMCAELIWYVSSNISHDFTPLTEEEKKQNCFGCAIFKRLTITTILGKIHVDNCAI